MMRKFYHPDEALGYLGMVARSYLAEPYTGLALKVINDPAFQTSYGARNHHHNYVGGLIQHTAEVTANCMEVGTALRLDLEVLLTSAIWHDYQKVKDYTLQPDGQIVPTDHHGKIYHIAGSAMHFFEAANAVGLDAAKRDAIVHCILAHHGRADWGSAITPQTPEAWTLHYADCLSAWFENGLYKEKKV